jgi:hypothetical protein
VWTTVYVSSDMPKTMAFPFPNMSMLRRVRENDHIAVRRHADHFIEAR